MTNKIGETDMNIYQRINAVIRSNVYIKRGSAGQGTGVLYDEVIATLRPQLATHGIIVVPEKIGEARSRLNAKDSYIYECDFAVNYINMDNPSDHFIDHVEAHAMDAGDKAPGKAITYATKISLVKVFQIETGINDESRMEHMKPVTKSQADQLAKALGNDDERIQRFTAHYSIESLADVPLAEFKGAMSAIRKSNEKENQA